MEGIAKRYTSPMLQGDPLVTECPTGYILRECPEIYETIEIASLVENADPISVSRMPVYLRRAARLVGSERARLRERVSDNDRLSRDSAYARKVLAGR